MIAPAASRAAFSRRGADAGYALLLVVFFAALMSIAAAAVAPSVLTQGLREREEEMIWRGEQYVRAIRVYYRKNGRFPQSVEDLTEKKVGTLRYLRQAYQDPMNREDGSWRFIYVGPGGQLIGSVTRTAGIQFGPQPGKAPGAQPPAKGPGPAPSPQPAPLGPSSGVTGPVLGGNIIGVGSKVEKPSLKVYNEKATYKEWEFIWDPTKDAAVIGVPGAPGGITRPPQPTPQQPRRP